MDMIPVASSNVNAVGYDEQAQSMTVIFQRGSQYVYRDVSAEEFARITEPVFSSATMRSVLANKPYARVES